MESSEEVKFVEPHTNMKPEIGYDTTKWRKDEKQ
jgi:hypothetical protein